MLTTILIPIRTNPRIIAATNWKFNQEGWHLFKYLRWNLGISNYLLWANILIIYNDDMLGVGYNSFSHDLALIIFQILKDDAVKVLHSICQQIWIIQQEPQDGKRSVFILIPKKGNAKQCSNYCTIALISHASKVMLKTLQARLQQYVNQEIPNVQAGFRKGRGTRDQIANILWIMEKAREFQKNIYFWSIEYVKAFDCVDTTNCGKFL